MAITNMFKRIIGTDQTRWKYVELLGVVLFLCFWFVLSSYVQDVNPERGDKILPTPKQVLESFPEFATYSMEAEGEPSMWIAFKVLLRHSGVSLYRLLSGTGLGILLGVSVGLC